jgi:hypothetical protein
MKLAKAMTVVLFAAATGCSFALDRNATQCQSDADCASFSGHPTCDQGVCVESGLGPEGCFAGTPQTQSDYLNACSTSKCVPFNNCDKLGGPYCNKETPLPPTMDPNNPAIPALLNPVAEPMNSCSDGIDPANVIYMLGAADFGPLMRAAQPLLSAGTPRFRAVFQNSSSCAGVSAVFGAAKMNNPPAGATGGWAFYFDDAGNQVNCKVDTAGNTIDIGVSDLYAQTCNPAFVPGAAVAEYTGPVVPFVLSVPATSSEQSISTEAAHIVFGLGGKSPSGMKDPPWNEVTNFSIRNSGAASTVLTALLTEVPRTKFWGVDRLTTDNLRDSLLTAPKDAVNSSIGILSVDYNDKNRGNLRALYLQARGQACGYQPDSSPTTYDKANVRDGHYPLWGYVHFFTPLGPGGVPSARANAMVLRFNVQKLEQRLLDDIINASLIPLCAMKVARTAEVGNFSPASGFQCGCYFDFKTKNKTSCKPCGSAEECPSSAPACNYGYCEAN